MPEGLSPTSDAIQLKLIPYPRYVLFRGAPFRPTPSNYLYIATEASYTTRRKCNLLCQQLLDLGFRTQIQSSSRLATTQAIFTTSASFPKWENLNRPLRPEAAGFQSYRISVGSEGVLLHGADEQGLQYAGATLRQLIEDGPSIPGMEIEDFPLLRWRVAHLDFKGWPPTIEYLKRTLTLLADLKFNAIILEYAAAFNFPSQPGLASEGALTTVQLADLEQTAKDLGVALIPLVPCIGNAGHVLGNMAYAKLREHPQFFQQYSTSNPASLDVVTAMMDDLIAIHPGGQLHIGGEEARLIGSNKATAARVKQAGGRTAVYLEYIGKVCRYLVSRGQQPLMWDDVLRPMSDEQIKWLPPETRFVCTQHDHQGSRVSTALLDNLKRYKKLGRSVWGMALSTPAARFDALDSIDAWAEAAEQGLIEGLVTTARTRHFPFGSLLPPPELAWHGAFYAAERAWSGTKACTREAFPPRFIKRMFGVKDESAALRIWAAFELYFREHPRRARELLTSEAKHVLRNRKTLGFFDAWLSLAGFQEYVERFETEISGNYALLQTGRGDPFHCGRLRWRILDAKLKLPSLVAIFQKQAQRLTHSATVQEYIESSVAYNLKRLDEMEGLLTGYPLPTEAFQQPVKL